MTSQFVNQTIIDDTSSNITYVGNWTHGVNVTASYNLYNNTDSYSGDQGATATLRFYGTGIEYWGNFYNTHGPCDLNLDGVDLGPVTAYASARSDPQLIYGKGDLELKDHVLILTIQSAATPNRCEIDRFVANITTGTANGSSPSSTPASNSKSSTGAIAGGVIGGVALVVLLVFGLWWYKRSTREVAPSLDAYNPDASIPIEKQPTPPAPVSAKAAYIGANSNTTTQPNGEPSSGSRSGLSRSGTDTWRPSSDLESAIIPQAPFQVPVFQPPPPAYEEH